MPSVPALFLTLSQTWLSILWRGLQHCNSMRRPWRSHLPMRSPPHEISSFAISGRETPDRRRESLDVSTVSNVDLDELVLLSFRHMVPVVHL
jgi:hypothetical protein